MSPHITCPVSLARIFVYPERTVPNCSKVSIGEPDYTTPSVFAENWINKRPQVWEQRRTNGLCAVSSQLEELHGKKYYCIGNGYREYQFPNRATCF